MSELMFTYLREVNEHEGETWKTWVQLTGNEDELAKFAELLSAVEDECDYYDFPYSFHPEAVEPESVVDKLVEYSESSYGYDHVKVKGKFTAPKTLGEDADDLYKGGIKEYFSE